MTKKCLDCKSNVIDDLESEMENEVPLWYKKAGNYSLLPKLLNCEDKFNPNKTELEVKTPDQSEITVEVPIKIKVEEDDKDGIWVFYWASLSNKELEINGPEAAYGDESNSGLIKTDKNGKGILKLDCPQPYRVNGITYPRHVHYVRLTNENVWSFDVKTLVVYCDLDRKQMEKILKSKDHIVINALSREDHENKSIPDSLNLPVGSLNPNNRDEKVKEFIENNIKKYPELEELIEKNKLDIKDVPIVTYCAEKECNASKELATHIINAGYSNVVEYPGGIKEWFDDSSDDDENFYDDSEDDKYELDHKYETIIINGIKYKHSLDGLDYILDYDDNKIGILKDEEVIWDSEEEKTNNEMLIETDDEDIDERTNSLIEKINKKEDEKKKEKDTSDEDTTDEDTTDEDTTDEDTSDDDTTDDTSDEEEKKQEKKGGNKLSYDGIYLCEGGNPLMNQSEYNQLFRGWGFTFL